MAEPDVIPMPERMPEEVVIQATAGVRFTPNELRALKEETGRSMTELMGPEADDADRMQTLAWLRLRRDGHPVVWEALGDIAIEVAVAELPDPTSAGR
jgi:hypothetical protein